MPSSVEFHTSKGEYDGAIPVVISSGRMAFASGAADSQNGSFVSPCNLTVVQAIIRVLTSATHANSVLNVGKQGDTDAFLDAYPMNAVAAGVREVPLTVSQWITKDIAKGDVVEFELAQSGNSVGTLAMTLVCMPTSVAG